MPIPNRKRRESREAEFVYRLAELFRRAGWRVVLQPQPGPDDWGADLIVDSGDKKYVVEVKRSAEGRQDRVIPLLSQAILQAQSAARRFSEPVVPVAVVAAVHIPDSAAEQVKQFAIRHAPDVGVGIMDSQGFRAFFGHGLEVINGERSSSWPRELSGKLRAPSHLFSDLNQWMLKILLSANIPESLVSVPRGRYLHASQLAQAAGVSVMSAFRLIRELSSEGFIDDRKGWFRLVRIEELMQRWLSAQQRSVREIPVRWIIRGGREQLFDAVQSYVSQIGIAAARPRRPQRVRLRSAPPRICIGLFAAADALGFGFVHGVAPHIYLERLEPVALNQLGLSVENVEPHPDVYIRIPDNEEAVFRAAVRRNGVPVSDIIQVWLDVSNHPARGKEQAKQIWKRVLAQSVHKGRQ